MKRYANLWVVAILACTARGWGQVDIESAAIAPTTLSFMTQDEGYSFDRDYREEDDERGFEDEESFDMYLQIGGLLSRDLELRDDEFGFDVDLEFDRSYGVAVAFGWDIFEVELTSYVADELDSATNNIFSSTSKDGEIAIVSIMFNLVFNAEFGGGFGGYVGGGVGIGFIDYDQTQTAGGSFLFSEANEAGFAYQFKAGLTFAISDRVSLYGGARAQFIDGLNFDIETEVRMVEFGIRIYF